MSRRTCLTRIGVLRLAIKWHRIRSSIQQDFERYSTLKNQNTTRYDIISTTMALECTECSLLCYSFKGMEDHYKVAHPKIHHEGKWIDVLAVTSIKNMNPKIHACHPCHRPFSLTDLRDERLELSECDPEDDSDCDRDEYETSWSRRGSLGRLFGRIKAKGRRGRDSSSSRTSHKYVQI
ncbi:hypothetical protein B0H10DRAFT_2183003 [Mycena sp. CBHHK59/15]|nr:hypothetical protein B0H10DRAFT_2183003 [Mycena sp. CBHHK59/15]